MYETQCVLIKTNAYFVIYQSPLFYLSGEITVLEIGNALNLFAILTTDNIHDRFFREKVSNTIVATKYRYACYYIDKLNKYTFICIVVILIFLFIEPEARDIVFLKCNGHFHASHLINILFTDHSMFTVACIGSRCIFIIDSCSKSAFVICKIYYRCFVISLRMLSVCNTKQTTVFNKETTFVQCPFAKL